MRSRGVLAAGLFSLVVASVAPAEIIEVRPKKPVNQAPKTPATRPAPRVPLASTAAPEAASVQTILEIDILSSQLQGDPAAQNWGKVFETLGASVRIRNGRDLKSEVTEKVRGSLRYVSASGLLNRDGELTFGANTFRLDDTEKLKEWIDELKLYGAQGAPEGKPLWGLNRAQFAIVNEQMTKPLAIAVQGKTLVELVQSLQNEAQLPVRLSTAAADVLKDPAQDRPITVQLTGFSTGTGLAIALNEIGFGLRPTRSPSSQIEYEVLPLDTLKDPWPMGWEPEEATPRNLITPNLYKMGIVGFEESALSEVLAAIQTESKTPIIVDTRRSLARKIDVTKISVSSPAKRTAWALVVTQCVRQAGLYNSIRQDEAGLGFVLIAPFEPKPIKTE